MFFLSLSHGHVYGGKIHSSRGFWSYSHFNNSYWTNCSDGKSGNKPRLQTDFGAARVQMKLRHGPKWPTMYFPVPQRQQGRYAATVCLPKGNVYVNDGTVRHLVLWTLCTEGPWLRRLGSCMATQTCSIGSQQRVPV